MTDKGCCKARLNRTIETRIMSLFLSSWIIFYKGGGMGEGETGCRVSIRRRRVSDVRPGEEK